MILPTLIHKALFLTIVVTAYSLPVAVSNTEILEKKIVKRSTNRQSSRNVSRSIVEGHTVEIKCEASGSTPPIIHWLFNGEHIEQSPLDHLAENVLPPLSSEAKSRERAPNTIGNTYFTVSTLLIKNASDDDAGIYTCVADLPGTRETKDYNITVVSPSEELTRRSDETILGSTRIYLYTNTVFEYENVTSVLICRGTQGPSKPQPVISWTLNEEPITHHHDNFQIQANGDLHILRTGRDTHMPFIKCIATGDDGTSAQVEPFIYIFAPEAD